MKRILASIVAVAMALFGLVVVQTVVAPNAFAACINRGMVVQLPDATVGGTTHDMKGYVNYRACGTYADITEVSYQIYPGNGDCGKGVDDDGAFYVIDEYRFNGDAIGGFNPTMTTWNCVVGKQSYVVWKASPGSAVVVPSDPASERCIVFNVKIVKNFGSDVTRTSDSKCVNFNN